MIGGQLGWALHLTLATSLLIILNSPATMSHAAFDFLFLITSTGASGCSKGTSQLLTSQYLTSAPNMQSRVLGQGTGGDHSLAQRLAKPCSLFLTPAC
eukprot:2349043-Rhodomonas_salina.3